MNVLVAAAVCPHPPLLVPDVAAGAAAELDGVRTSCDVAVRRLLATRPDVVVVVGAAPVTGERANSEAGGLAAYGADVRVGSGPATLPLSLTLGKWLLERSGNAVPHRLYGVREDAPPEEVLRLGEELATSAGRVGLLVMGDGSARRGERAPGYPDPRAESFDGAVTKALGSGDASTLAGINSELAAELLAAGRAAWQVLAGAAGQARFDTGVLANEAPYGVSYFVAAWTRWE